MPFLDPLLDPCICPPFPSTSFSLKKVNEVSDDMLRTLSVLTRLDLGSVVGRERRDASTVGHKRNFICINKESTNFPKIWEPPPEGWQWAVTIPEDSQLSSVLWTALHCGAFFAGFMWTDTRRYISGKGVGGWTAVITLKIVGATVEVQSPGRQAFEICKSKIPICVVFDYYVLPFDVGCVK